MTFTKVTRDNDETAVRMHRGRYDFTFQIPLMLRLRREIGARPGILSGICFAQSDRDRMIPGVLDFARSERNARRSIDENEQARGSCTSFADNLGD